MSRSINFRRSVLALSCGSLLAGNAAAGGSLYEFNGTKNNDRLGVAVANAGDLNGDGRNDLIGGAPEDGNLIFAGNGFIRAYSGMDGSVLFTTDGDPTGLSFGASVSGMSDVNNDGTPDVIVGSPFTDTNSFQAAGQVAVVDGTDGSIMMTVDGGMNQETLGRAVTGLGDLNGDGFDEFAGGSHAANNDRGVCRVFNGQSGLQLYQFDGIGLGDRLGVSISRIGDVNSDGTDDILVGSAFDGVYVYSGATGAEIRHIFLGGDQTMGSSVANIADINGDGVEDIIAGSPQFDIFAPGTGRTYIFNGATGSILLTINGANIGDGFGDVVADAGDWDGDGTNDVVVTSNPLTGANFVTVHSGVNGALLNTYNPANDGDDLGRGLAGLGPIDGDGKATIAMGAPQTTGTFLREGLIRVEKSSFSVCGGVTQYCTSNPNSSGSTATIAAFGSTNLSDNAILVQASNCPANTQGLFFYAPDQVTIPFGDGVRCVGGAIQRLSVTPTNGAGVASNAVLADPNNAIVVAGAFNYQYWFRDIPAGGAGFNTSNAIQISYCP